MDFSKLSGLKFQSLKAFQDAYNDWKIATKPLGPYSIREVFRNPRNAGDLETLARKYVELLREKHEFPVMISKIDVKGTWVETEQKFVAPKSTKGVSDLILCVDGRFVAIEVKYGRDKIRETQIRWRELLRRANGQYYIAANFSEIQGIVLHELSLTHKLS